MPIINQVVQGGGGSGPAHYIEKTVDANGKLVNGSNIINLTGATDVGAGVLSYAYNKNINITGSLDLSELTKVSGADALNNGFNGCTGITSVDLSNLEEITGNNALSYCFSGCTGLTSILLSSLKKVSGSYGGVYLVSGCTALTNLSLPALEIISGGYGIRYMCYNCQYLTSFSAPSLVVANQGSTLNSLCQGCQRLTSADLSSLKVITGSSEVSNAFAGCKLLTDLKFPALTTTSFGSNTNQFVYMCGSIPDITLHFPSNIQSVIEGLQGYSTTAPFSATSGTVLFDLPATNILTGANTVEYERNPKYDTATALAWRVKDTGTLPNLTIDWTPFYTSGTTDPSVADTIYSDDACTQSVTTITAIA